MLKRLGSAFNHPQAGITLVILALAAIMTKFSPTHVDHLSGQTVNNFLNASTLLQVATDTSFFAVMAVGMTVVIISGGIDLSVGSIYAMSGVLTAMLVSSMHVSSPWVGLLICSAIGSLAGLVNGMMVSKLNVHPFIITLGTMWVYRGIAFVTTHAQTQNTPQSYSDFAKANLGLGKDLYPVPLVFMLAMTVVGGILLSRTVWGRRVFAVGGNVQAARYSGVPVGTVLTGVYVLSGLTAGIAAFLGISFYGGASSGDAQGYELFVIASAVVGGASLIGGKGGALGGLMGALLIQMIHQSIITLGLDQNYEWIIVGTAIVVAVVLDRVNSQLAQKRLARA